LRFVLDTNIFVSYLLRPDTSIAAIVDRIFRVRVALYSDETIVELSRTLRRPKFAAYATREDMRALLAAYVRTGSRVRGVAPVLACRDPKDDKFLALAVAGQADAIVTGDEDLLALHPFRGIPILRPPDVARLILP